MGPLQNNVLFVRSAVTIGLVTLALSGLFSSSDAAPGTQQDRGRWSVARQGQTPLAFVENRGQVDPRVEFYLRTPGQVVWVTRDGIVFDLLRQTTGRDPDVKRPGKRSLLSEDRTSRPTKERLVFAQDLVGADLARRIEAGAVQPGVYNYFIGNDPARWRTGVRAYADVVYRDVWTGIDLKLYGNGRALEQEFVVRPGADPSRVQVAYRGIEGLAIAPDGSLRIRTAFGELHESTPRIYQEIGGKRVEVTGRYKLLSPTSYAFEVGAYDRMLALVIDPTLTYSTYLGGSGSEEGRGIAVDEVLSVYVAGMTTSIDFPTTIGPANPAGRDAFVTKLTPDGSQLEFSTYLGGSGDDEANSIAVNVGGTVAVVGQTDSGDFPLSSAFQGSFGGGLHDAFVAHLDTSGVLHRSSYLGGSNDDIATGVALDSAHNVYVTGGTDSTNFPTGGTFVFQSVINCSIPSTCVPIPGAADAFVTKIDSSWTIGYSTYLGGSSFDGASAIAVDGAGNAYVTGATQSFDFAPGAGGIAGGQDAFAARFDATGHLTWATFFGGGGDDNSFGIAVDGLGMVYLTGVTDTPFGTPIRAFAGLSDAFVAKLDPVTLTVPYFTFLGGTDAETGQSIAVDARGHAYVAGITSSADYPTQGTALPSGTPGGAWDVFVANFDIAGNLKYSAVIGAEATDVTNGVAVDPSGAVYLTGYTTSTDFPTAGSPPYQATPGPGTDGGPTSQEDTFIAKISPAATTTVSSLTNPSTAGQNVTFNITVSIGGSPATSGNVRVYADLSLIRDFVLSPTQTGQQLTFVYAPPSAGEHQITVYYEPAVASPVDLYSVAGMTQFVVGGGTVATAVSAPLVVSPLTGSSGPQRIGDILIAETIGGSILTTGRVTLMTPPGMTFAPLPTALPRVSASVAHGLQIVQSGADAPSIDGIGDQFSFKLQTSSSGGAAVLLISGISVIVQSGFVPGSHFTLVDGSGVSQNAVVNVKVATESTTPAFSSLSHVTVGQGADDFTIVLTGINFLPGATVSFSRLGLPVTGITIVSITVDSASQITIKLDIAGNTILGPIDVTVSNPGGGSLTLPSALSITAAPTVTGTFPSPVFRTALKQSVRLIGTGFQAPTQSPPNIGLAFSGTGIRVLDVGYNSETELIVDVEVAVTAALTARTVTITNPDGGTSTSGAVVVLADPPTTVIVGEGPKSNPPPPPVGPPTISSLSPPSARRGTLVQVTGEGFSSIAAENKVTFTGTGGSQVTVSVASVTVNSAAADTLTVIVPSGAADGPVVVGVKGLVSNALAFGVTDPALSAVVPRTPAVLGGTAVLDITGSKFTAGSTVEFALSAGAPIGSVNGITSGPITLTGNSIISIPITIVSTAFAGPRDVTVRNLDGSFSTRAQAFRIFDPNEVAFDVKVLNALNQDITASFLPAVDASVTLDASGRCTAKIVTPRPVRLRATYIGTSAVVPTEARFELTQFTSYLGTAINDDCEFDPLTPSQRTLVASRDVALSGVTDPAPSVHDPASLTAVALGSGVYEVTLWTYDWGAGAVVRVSRTDAVFGTATVTLPVDADGDTLPDAFEEATTLANVNASGAAVVELNVTAGGARVLDRLSAAAGGSVKSVADGYTNFEKYRGLYLKGPANGGNGALEHHIRLGAGQRHLFLRGHGFAGDHRLGAGQCGVEPPVSNRGSVNFAEWTAVSDASGAACPRFEVGTAFAAESIQVHDVTPAFSASTAFPRRSFQTGVEATADVGELAYDAFNCNGGEPCDHISKTGPRNWKFWTYGVSAVGSAGQYGVGARVLKKVVDALFGDLPYEHRTNDPARVVRDAAGNPMLAPLTIVADNSGQGSDNGVRDGAEPVDATLKLLGDTYILPANYGKDFSVFDVNKDRCTELPLVTDPTTLTRCADPNTAVGPPGQATRQQVVRLTITHEVGHMIGASIYHNTNPLSVNYQFTTNWNRDNLFGPETAPELRIHNRGQQ